MVDDSFRVLSTCLYRFKVGTEAFFFQDPFLDLDVFSPEIHVMVWRLFRAEELRVRGSMEIANDYPIKWFQYNYMGLSLSQGCYNGYMVSITMVWDLADVPLKNNGR